MDQEILDSYETIIGLEIHVQLNTLTKAYSSDPVQYGAPPNTQVNPVSLGHPGTLPMVNEAVIESAVMLGLSCDCTIREVNEYARKNYFYADLPKGYQITQDKTPICTGGAVVIKDAEGNPKSINLTRIHMEEDSGKSIHDIDPFHSLIDLNRAGTPLLEIVSEPDFRNGTEAYNYLSEMRKLVRYLDISDGNMEEGSLRCDVNISVRKKGAQDYGTRVEVKNLNSFRNVQKSIDFEVSRQIELIENGGEVEQATLTFDAVSGKTQLLRAKEDAHDYRYFNEPDISPVLVKDDYIESVRAELPALPRELFRKYLDLGLNEYAAQQITENKEVAHFYEAILEHTDNYTAAANWIMGPVKSYLNEQAVGIVEFPLSGKTIAKLISLTDAGTISNSAATGELWRALLSEPNGNPEKLAKDLNLLQESDESELMEIVHQALAKYPDKVEAYRNGKKGVQGLFMGEVMKLSGGKADPKVASKLVTQELEK